VAPDRSQAVHVSNFHVRLKERCMLHHLDHYCCTLKLADPVQSSADELAHQVYVGVAVWGASTPRTTQQGQAESCFFRLQEAVCGATASVACGDVLCMTRFTPSWSWECAWHVPRVKTPLAGLSHLSRTFVVIEGIGFNCNVRITKRVARPSSCSVAGPCPGHQGSSHQ
jgi:hypothetical protein